MERLTEKHYLGTDHYMKCSGNCNVDMDCIDCPSFDRLVERLAAYEDTGLEPEEVLPKDKADEIALKLMRLANLENFCSYIRLRELAEADKDGRLAVLPTKTVFELTWDAGPDCDLVCPVSIDGHGCCDFCDKGKLCIYERECQQGHIEQIGKTVFLTREEAEKALEAMQNE